MYWKVVHGEGLEKAAQELNWFGNNQFLFDTDLSTSTVSIT